MKTANVIYPLMVQNVFSQSEIQSIEEMQKTFESGRVHHESTQNSRSCDVAWIDHTFHPWLRAKVDEVAKISNTVWEFQLEGCFEPFQYTLYDKEGDHYDLHLDIGPDGLATNRKISIVIMLNDGYEGGELEIHNSINPICVKLPYNTAIVFPSFLMHRVSPVTKGIRKSLVCWYHGPSFR
jgi:PKHD-type hydroxylase